MDEVTPIDEVKTEETPAASAALTVRGSLDDLASRLDEGKAIIVARESILATARAAAIRMTDPEDWLLFKDKQGREVAYLQDCGCERVRPIFGISTYDVSPPQKVSLTEGGFIYMITGSGRCGLTQEIIESVTGGRASTDDYIAKQDPAPKGAQLELLVMKAARSNLEGNIVRALAGLKSVPITQIMDAYQGTSKGLRGRFREGRGYGKQSDREHTGAVPTNGEQSHPAAANAISEGQRKRMYAIYKNAGWQDSEVKDFLLREYNIASSADIPRDKYDEICRALESGGKIDNASHHAGSSGAAATTNQGTPAPAAKK